MHSIGFTMTEPPRNIFFVCFWRKRRTECTPSEVSSPLGARHLHRECAEDFEPSHLLANMLRVPRWCDEACEFLERHHIRPLPGLVHQGTLHQARGSHPVHRSDRLHQALISRSNILLGMAKFTWTSTPQWKLLTSQGTPIETQDRTHRSCCTLCLSKKSCSRTLTCVSHVNSIRSSVPQEDISACKSKNLCTLRLVAAK